MTRNLIFLARAGIVGNLLAHSALTAAHAVEAEVVGASRINDLGATVYYKVSKKSIPPRSDRWNPNKEPYYNRTIGEIRKEGVKVLTKLGFADSEKKDAIQIAVFQARVLGEQVWLARIQYSDSWPPGPLRLGSSPVFEVIVSLDRTVVEVEKRKR
jgi:hypothetical protein